VVPAHNNGYLIACRIAEKPEPDVALLWGTHGHPPIPEPIRSLAFKPLMWALRAS
jgi:hypothetical protein